MLKTQKIDYQDGDVLLEGFYAYDEQQTGQRPAILVAHDWSGKNDFSCQKAERLAELGYVGFALDMYGKGKKGETKEEKAALMQPLMEDRALLEDRVVAAFNAAKQLAMVDKNKIGAIGFCFGGLCVLDLARSGVDVKGVVSFHGLLKRPEGVVKEPIKAKVLILHGFDDPMVKMDQVIDFGEEMDKAKVDWEVDIYGHCMHAFTNPQANDPGFGTVYNKEADVKSWARMKKFFKNVLS